MDCIVLSCNALNILIEQENLKESSATPLCCTETHFCCSLTGRTAFIYHSSASLFALPVCMLWKAVIPRRMRISHAAINISAETQVMRGWCQVIRFPGAKHLDIFCFCPKGSCCLLMNQTQ